MSKQVYTSEYELTFKQNTSKLTPQSVKAKECRAPLETEITFTWSLRRVCTGCGAWYSKPTSSVPNL